MRTVSVPDILEHLHRIAKVTGLGKLRFTPEQIGTYLLRSVAIMAMFLDNILVFIIILIGR